MELIEAFLFGLLCGLLLGGLIGCESGRKFQEISTLEYKRRLAELDEYKRQIMT